MQHYLFGYGSLFSKESRAHTAHTPQAALATLHGFERSWCFEDPEGYCALGITAAPHSAVNGVVVHVKPEQLPAFDKREAGYMRKNVTENVGWEGKPKEDVTIWTYVVEPPLRAPHTQHPIAQTYLDVVLHGCLEHHAEVAAQFLGTTLGWERTWVNDRERPIFRRGLPHAACGTIDNLLALHGFSPKEFRLECA